MRTWLAPPNDATSREVRALDVAAVALVVAGIATVVCAVLGSTLGALAGLVVVFAGWVTIGVVLLRVTARRGRRIQAELEERRRQLIARHEARLAELAELRRRFELDDEREGRS